MNNEVPVWVIEIKLIRFLALVDWLNTSNKGWQSVQGERVRLMKITGFIKIHNNVVNVNYAHNATFYPFGGRDDTPLANGKVDWN